MTGVGSRVLPSAAIDEIEQWFELDRNERKEDDAFDCLGCAVASYRGDLEAWAMQPSAADERADLRAINEDCTVLLETWSHADALRLWQRILNFPPVSRGLVSDVVRELVQFERALVILRDYLPRPATWPHWPMDLSLRLVAACCLVANPPAFTKRPKTARDRLIRELGKLYDAHEVVVVPKGRDDFTRAILEALKIDSPDRLNSKPNKDWWIFDRDNPKAHFPFE